ncbi:MAG: hypothetical protein JWP02_3825 [Acidimicrobiales bacterium]|nr:hypothetical protein [Acidimicrobiales bacterium]
MRVGTSGWSYKEWVGRFYPARTPASRLLTVYAGRLPTVEAHNTFRRRPLRSTLESWAGQVPATFLFAPKAHVAITHQRDLEGVEERVGSFFESLSPLGEHLGPVLFQLPHVQPDLDRLDRLLAALPEGAAAAFELGPAWHTPDVLARLDRRGATVVVVDKDGDMPPLVDAGACSYLRLRRERYTDAELEAWARRLIPIAASGRPVYVYLRHEGDPEEALRLADLVRG